MTSSRREDERVHKNAIFNRLSTGVSSAFNTYTFLKLNKCYNVHQILVFACVDCYFYNGSAYIYENSARPA
jgi:hypothetical protein